MDDGMPDCMFTPRKTALYTWTCPLCLKPNEGNKWACRLRKPHEGCERLNESRRAPTTQPEEP